MRLRQRGGLAQLERPLLWTPKAYIREGHAALLRAQAGPVRSPIRHDQKRVVDEYLAGWRDRGWTKADLNHFRCAAANKTLIVASGGLTTSVTAYTALDQVATQFTHTNFGTGAGLGGILTGVGLYDETNIIGTYSVHIGSASMTPAADNAAYSVSDPDGQLVLPGMPIMLGQVFLEGLNRISAWQGALSYNCAATSLFSLLRTEAGHTFFTAVTSLKLSLTAITI